MPTLHSASQSKAQCGIFRLNYTTHLGLPMSALKVFDALFKSFEVQSRQTEITMISGAPKLLRKQSEKSSFGLLGRLQLHICITDLRVGSCTWVNSAPVTSSRVQMLGDARARLPAHTFLRPRSHSSVTVRVPALVTVRTPAPWTSPACMHVRTSPTFACLRSCPSPRLRAPVSSCSPARASNRVLELPPPLCTPEYILPSVPACPNV
ncbi:hypothetical protein CRG98_021391 [Punica granatum]|uniref:Uncharacterized protein n=1 Tax=Punica granatum TaxID=22663 RepID=A0A2I0JQN3_PUNGR|nr:hypothetical protein CRG98_021391 [Punica granatum]